jgi:hypothetical protein
MYRIKQFGLFVKTHSVCASCFCDFLCGEGKLSSVLRDQSPRLWNRMAENRSKSIHIYPMHKASEERKVSTQALRFRSLCALFIGERSRG